MPRSQRIPPTTRNTAAENKRRLEAEDAAKKAEIARKIREGDMKPIIPTGRRNSNKAAAEKAMIDAKQRNAAVKARVTGKSQKAF